jgi:hypothetical protein
MKAEAARMELIATSKTAITWSGTKYMRSEQPGVEVPFRNRRYQSKMGGDRIRTKI